MQRRLFITDAIDDLADTAAAIAYLGQLCIFLARNRLLCQELCQELTGHELDRDQQQDTACCSQQATRASPRDTRLGHLETDRLSVFVGVQVEVRKGTLNASDNSALPMPPDEQ